MKISVVGLGFVGTVTAACLASRGHHVVGVDADRSKIDMVLNGRSPVLEPGVEELIAAARRTGHLDATPDLKAAVAASDISLVCVGLAGNADKSEKTGPLEALIRQLGAAITEKRRFHSVVVRSTILPATMRQRLLPILEQAAGRLGENFGLAHHPEFMREGNAIFDFCNAPRTIVGELEARTAELLVQIYSEFSMTLVRTTPELSAMTKYADNAWHALKVAFANEVGTICSVNGIDAHALLEIFSSDTRLNISSAYLKPGFAYGGSCLAKDLGALVRWGEQADLDIPLLSHINPSNERHLKRSVDWLLAAGKHRFALLGLATKAGTDDLRASPFLSIARELRAAGRESRAYDPDVSQGRRNPSHHDYTAGIAYDLDSLLTDDLPALIAWADAIVICSSTIDTSSISPMLRDDHVLLDFARIGHPGQSNYAAFM